MCAGTFTVLCPKFISEVAPTEYKGPFGAMSQFMCVFGILAVTLMGLPVPNCITEGELKGSFYNPTLTGCSTSADQYCVDLNSFIVTQYWRVVWGIPAIIAII